MSDGAKPGKQAQQVIELLGVVTGTGSASAALQKKLGIPVHVIQAANHHGIWDVTALLPYLKNVS